MNVPDVYDQWKAHEQKQERRLSQFPECDYCHKPILDEHYFEINGDVMCEKCLNNNFRKDTDDYVE